MSALRAATVLTLLCLSACAFGGAPAAAAKRPSATPVGQTVSTAAPTAASSPGRVTVLALDMSGSMGGRDGNDPNNVRCAAARAFIALSRPNDMVGLIGFGDHTWAVPPARTTPAGKQELEAAVRCQLDGNTPTRDALAKAWQWLSQYAGSGAGGVVLLTDGVPTPNSQGQIADIQDNWAPMFASHHWRIDTIALGTGQEGRDIEFDFLQRLSAATNGQFTDGSHRQAATVRNLLPAFVGVLRDEAGRSPGLESSDPLAFTVPPAAAHLDVVVVCQDSCSRVQLLTPAGAPESGGQPIEAGSPPSQYGEVFSVDGSPLPWQPGASWQVRVAGGGQVEVESLVDLQLHVVVQVAAPPHPMGGPVAITASVEEADGTPFGNDQLTVDGTVRHVTGGRPVSGADFALVRGAGGQYAGVVKVPGAEGPDTYDVTVSASTDVPVATGSSTMDVGLFPHPALSPAATATRWPFLGGLYSLPVLGWFGGLALQGPPSPTATVTGTLLGPDGRPYTRTPILSAAVPRSGGAASARTTGPGLFAVTFPAARGGDYPVTVWTGGPDSFGETLPATATVHVTVANPTAGQLFRAVLVTALLAALLAVLLAYVRFCGLPSPYGALVPVGGGRPQPLGRRRGPLDAFVRRDHHKRRDGIEFRFGRTHIEVRRHRTRTAWRRCDGTDLSTEFRWEGCLLLREQIYTVDDSYGRLAPWADLPHVVARALGMPARRRRQRR